MVVKHGTRADGFEFKSRTFNEIFHLFGSFFKEIIKRLLGLTQQFGVWEIRIRGL